MTRMESGLESVSTPRDGSSGSSCASSRRTVLVKIDAGLQAWCSTANRIFLLFDGLRGFVAVLLTLDALMQAAYRRAKCWASIFLKPAMALLEVVFEPDASHCRRQTPRER